uniref:DUF7729 domain-containing protein n=1 Tax=Phakopsora pachyrhizi TaxID=170000 RepID=A0A0S1MJP0_PHAPC
MPTLRSIRYRRTLLACIGIMSSISAQNITSDFPASDTLSTACRDSINNLINGEFGKCSKISDLIQFAYSNNSNPLSRYSNYVKNFCEAEVCSSEILSKTVKSLRSTCLSDLKTGSIDVIRTYATSSQYSLLRNSLCLRRVSDSTLCLTSMLDELQVFGKVPFSVSQIENVVIGGFPSIISSLDNLPCYLAQQLTVTQPYHRSLKAFLMVSRFKPIQSYKMRNLPQ